MNALLFLQIVAPLIPHVIRLTEQLIPGPKKGKKKRAHAIATIEQLAAAVPALAVNVEKIARDAGKMIDEAVAKMNAGEVPPP